MSRSSSIRRLPWVLAAILAAMLLAGFAGKLWWVFDLAAHFRMQYAYAAAMLIGWFVMLRAWRGVAFVVLVLVVDLIGVFALASSNPVQDGALERAPLRLLFANVHTSNREHQRLLDQIEIDKPDLVLLQEIDEIWVLALEPLAKSYPHRFVEARPDNFGIGVYSKLALEDSTIRYWGSQLPTIETRVQHAGRPITILFSHPCPPTRAVRKAMRDAQLLALAREAKARSTATILIGDFNITPWSPTYAEVLEISGLLDSTQGYGPQVTWPTRLPTLCRIPLDHCFHSPDLAVTERRVGPAIGSDHLPLFVEIR